MTQTTTQLVPAPSDGELEFRVLGQLAVVRGGSELALGGRRRRLVLAVLLCEAGRVVPAERLVDEIWGASRPGSGTGPLRTYIWELRRLLDHDTTTAADRMVAENETLVSRDAGYLLDIERNRIDSVRFEELFSDARAAAASGQSDSALAGLEDALGLWRGPVFGDLADEPALEAETQRLGQVLLEAKELRAELMLAIGQEARVVTELGEVARSHPERERLWGMLMIALYRSGRQGDALRCFQEARTKLVEEMGLEPGHELRQLEQAILHQDPALRGTGWPGWWLGGGSLVADAANGSLAGRLEATPDAASTATGSVRHNLPRRLTSLVGRGSERAAVADLLDGSRMVTLTGSGGCGKTRLALAVAEDVLPRFPGGVWFVDLSAVADPDLVACALAESLEVEVSRTDWLGHLRRRIADEEVLLVLDNCEHLVDAVAEVAEQLLTHCGSLCILATSREELRVQAESVWRVPGLALPSMNGHDDHVPMLDSDAVQLFVERGRSALAGFAPSGEALEAVAQVCRRLDGIPLAIELAAALVGSVPVAEIVERLDDRLRLLTAGRRSGIPRHRTLGATLDWSFDLLDEPAQTLFVKLGVFVGSFSLPAAEAVAGPGTEADPLAVARGVGHLVRTSMLDCVSGSDGAQRYRMQETIRQYARDRLEQLEDSDETHRGHACYFADFVAGAEPHAHGPDASTWLERVVVELPNLRAAAAWAFSHHDIEVGLRLADSAHPFFARMALLDEAARWLDAGLGSRERLAPASLLKALTTAGNVAFSRGEFSRARQLGEEAVALARDLDDARELPVALMVCGAAAVWVGDLPQVEECFTEADELWAHRGFRWARAWMLTCWAAATHDAGQTERAHHQIAEAMDIFRSMHDLHGQVFPLAHLAQFSLEADRLDEAQDLANEAARIAVSVDGRDMQHVSFCVRGVVELAGGHLQQGRELLVKSVRDFPGSRNWLIVTRALESLAGLSLIAGQHSDAAALLGFAQHVRERWHFTSPGKWAALLAAWREALSAGLGPERFELQLSRGRSMDLEAAVRLAEAATASVAAGDSSQPR